MEVGKNYIVTKRSDDGTFRVGDRIILNTDGSIGNKNVRGEIEACDVAKTTKGMEYEVAPCFTVAKKKKPSFKRASFQMS